MFNLSSTDPDTVRKYLHTVEATVVELTGLGVGEDRVRDAINAIMSPALDRVRLFLSEVDRAVCLLGALGVSEARVRTFTHDVRGAHMDTVLEEFFQVSLLNFFCDGNPYGPLWAMPR
jgi:hypothetical protein